MHITSVPPRRTDIVEDHEQSKIKQRSLTSLARQASRRYGNVTIAPPRICGCGSSGCRRWFEARYWAAGQGTRCPLRAEQTVAESESSGRRWQRSCFRNYRALLLRAGARLPYGRYPAHHASFPSYGRAWVTGLTPGQMSRRVISD